MATVLVDGVYSIKREIGKGGMAVVYLAGVDHTRFDYTTLYAYTQAQAPTHLERRREADALTAALRHMDMDVPTMRRVLESDRIPLPGDEVALKVAIGS